MVYVIFISKNTEHNRQILFNLIAGLCTTYIYTVYRHHALVFNDKARKMYRADIHRLVCGTA